MERSENIVEKILFKAFLDQLIFQFQGIGLAATTIQIARNEIISERFRTLPLIEKTTLNVKLFYAVQSLLTSYGIISKILYGQGGRKRAERKRFREHIGWDENDDMFSNTKMRNNFDHIDERLEKMSQEDLRVTQYRCTGRVLAENEMGIVQHFDTTTGDVLFFRDRLSLKTVVDYVNKYLPKLEEKHFGNHSFSNNRTKNHEGSERSNPN